MSGKFLSKLFLSVIFALLAANLYAQESGSKNMIDNSNVLLGIGAVFHQYTEQDDFRKPSGLFGTADELKYGAGLQLNAELLLNNTFSLSLPFGLGVGYKFQILGSSVKYSTLSGSTLDKKVEISNNIGYVSIYIPLDSEKYWLLGGSAGYGASNYKYTLDYSNSTPDVSYSSKGSVIPLSVFLDWGADGFGARFGYTYVMSKYPAISGSTPKGNGNQFYFDLRYAI